MRYRLCLFLFIVICKFCKSQSTLNYFKSSIGLTHVAYKVDDAGQRTNQSVTLIDYEASCNSKYFKYVLHSHPCLAYSVSVEGDKVYRINNQLCFTNHLLYDFAMQVGEKAILNRIECELIELSNITLKDGETRLMQVIKPVNSQSSNTYRVVQGIGNIDGSFIEPFYDQILTTTTCQGILNESDTIISNDFSALLSEDYYCLNACGQFTVKTDSLTVFVQSSFDKVNPSEIDWGDGTISSFIDTISYTYTDKDCYTINRTTSTFCDTITRSINTCLCQPSFWQLDTVFIPNPVIQSRIKTPLNNRTCITFRDSTFEFKNGEVAYRFGNTFSYEGINYKINHTQTMVNNRLLFFAKPEENPNDRLIVSGYIEQGIIYPTLKLITSNLTPSINKEHILLNKGTFRDTTWISVDGANSWDLISPPSPVDNYKMYTSPKIFGDTIIQIFDRGWPYNNLIESKIGVSYDLGKNWSFRNISHNRKQIKIVSPDWIYFQSQDSLFVSQDQFISTSFLMNDINTFISNGSRDGFFQDINDGLFYSNDGFKNDKQNVSNINYSLQDLFLDDNQKWHYKLSNENSITLYDLNFDSPSDCRPDNDRDGLRGGDDCDDHNASVFHGNIEIPYDGLDNDCLSETLDDDLDMDGFGIDEDCNDLDPSVNPQAIDIPNGIDDNCDGIIDGTTSTKETNYKTLNVYPSPAQNHFFLESNSPILKIIIYDLQGRTIFNDLNTNNIKKKINCSTWSHGLHIIQVIDSSNKISNRKVMVF